MPGLVRVLVVEEEEEEEVDREDCLEILGQELEVEQVLASPGGGEAESDPREVRRRRSRHVRGCR